MLYYLQIRIMGFMKVLVDVVRNLWFNHKLKNGEIKLAIGDIFAQPSVYYQKLQNRNLIKTNNEQTISLTLNLNL